MYTRIKELADSAVALQNKINMEAALRKISGICEMALNPLADGVLHDYRAPEDNPVVVDGDLTEASLAAVTSEVLASGEKLSIAPTQISFPESKGAKSMTKKAAKK
jgi:hypothetical protein